MAFLPVNGVKTTTYAMTIKRRRLRYGFSLMALIKALGYFNAPIAKQAILRKYTGSRGISKNMLTRNIISEGALSIIGMKTGQSIRSHE